MMEFILASGSPRRKELFSKIVPAFRIVTADVDERAVTITDPSLLCGELATLKCRAVAASLPECCVIGCDTMVAADGQLLGKPADFDDAMRMLRLLSGREHDVYTGVHIEAPGVSDTFVTRTGVVFDVLTEEEMIRYASTPEPYDKAGAYGIQDTASLFVKGITGDYFNVMGLPVHDLYVKLRDYGLLSL